MGKRKISNGICDMPAEAYHDLPALNAGGAWTIVERSPLHFWTASPLNPDYKPDHNRVFDIGVAAHLACLEPDRFAAATTIIDADDYRTKAAREARDAAYTAGKTPLLAKQVDQVTGVRAALLQHSIARDAFTQGSPEVTFCWRDPKTDIPCKARADWLRPQHRQIVDLKCHANASPKAFPRVANDLGYYARAAWYIDGFKLATGQEIESYAFVAIERDPPHAVGVFFYDERALEHGRLKNRQAIATLAQCIVRDECPGYRDPKFPDRDRAFQISLPTYAEFQMQERIEAGEFRAELPDPADLKRAFELYKP